MGVPGLRPAPIPRRKPRDARLHRGRAHPLRRVDPRRRDQADGLIIAAASSARAPRPPPPRRTLPAAPPPPASVRRAAAPRGRPGRRDRPRSAGARGCAPMPISRKAVPSASFASSGCAAANSVSGRRVGAGQAGGARARREAGGLELQHDAGRGQVLLPQPPRRASRTCRHSGASSAASAAMSVSKVVSALIDLVSRSGVTRRLSSPRARAASAGPVLPEAPRGLPRIECTRVGRAA